jgi:hypothetical protein
MLGILNQGAMDALQLRKQCRSHRNTVLLFQSIIAAPIQMRIEQRAN